MSQKTISIDDLFPPEYRDEDGIISLSRIAEYRQKCYDLADEITRARNVSFQQRKTIFLIDVQGIYLALIEWMGEKGIPVAGGELLSRFAVHLLSVAMLEVEDRERLELDPKAIDYEDLYLACYRKDRKKLEFVEAVNRLLGDLELFFAPFPLKEVKAHLSKRMLNGKNIQLRKDTDAVENGIVKLPWGERNYRFYDKFVADIKDGFDVRRMEKGFFNFYVNAQGLKYCDEKEVDIRIAIRAMDIAIGGEAEAICIVSSDQDFMPLHDRCRDAGLRTYHADVAKFSKQANVGRKIRELGADAIAVVIPKDLAWRIIQEYVTSPSLLSLTPDQYKALWNVHCENYDDPYHPYG